MTEDPNSVKGKVMGELARRNGTVDENEGGRPKRWHTTNEPDMANHFPRSD